MPQVQIDAFEELRVQNDLCVREFFQLINEKPNKEKTNEFVQKLTSFIQATIQLNSSISEKKFVNKKNYNKFKDFLQHAIDAMRLCKEQMAEYPDQNVTLDEIMRWMKFSEKYFDSARGILNVDAKIIRAIAQRDEHKIESSKLQTGDILAQISYPTDILDIIHHRFFNFLKGSEVNHVLLIVKQLGEVYFFDFVAKGMRYKPFKTRPGIVYIAMRQVLNESQREAIYTTVRQAVKTNSPFSTPERLGAYLSLFISKLIPFPTGNMFENKDAYYCSEFIDETFRNKLNIVLTHKSDHSNTVLASDLLASSKLNFIGFVCDDSEQTKKIFKILEKDPDL